MEMSTRRKRRRLDAAVLPPGPAAYGRLLRELPEARGHSGAGLARVLAKYPAQLARTEAGTSPPDGPEEVLRTARALGLGPEERDRLLEAAGYWPAAFLELGPADPTLRALAAALSDPGIPPEARRRLRTIVEAATAALATLADENARLRRTAAGAPAARVGTAPRNPGTGGDPM